MADAQSFCNKRREIFYGEIDSTRNKLKVVYHAVDDWKDGNAYNHETIGGYVFYGDRDILETQYFFNLADSSGYAKLYAKRQDDGHYTTPTTGDDSVSRTNIISLKYKLDKHDAQKKILHIELEMESKVSRHKIKIATAVFMPSYEKEDSQ